MTDGSESPERIRELVARCLGLLEEGDLAGVDALLEAHRDVSRIVRDRLTKLQVMGLVETPQTSAKFPDRLGEFRLVERLGGGGMGVVYLAEQPSLKRRVALKVLRHEQLFFPQARERFRREVELVSGLHHPGIVPVYAVGEDEGIPYFTMEWVRGCTLSQVLRTLGDRDPRTLRGRDILQAIHRVTGEEEPSTLPGLFEGTWVDASSRIVQQIADALQHVHEHGIVHRDLKPSNVMITRAGRVQLLDFGLASPQDGSRITRTGVLTGSVPYLAPELLDGTHKPDERTDVYALGVTFYELLTLQCPFLAPSGEETRRRVLEARPPAPRRINQEITWELETLCLVAMERDARRRYASVHDLATDLENVRAGRPLAARRPNAWLRVRRWAGRHPSTMVGASSALVLLTVFSLVYASSERSARRALDEQRERALANLSDARDAVTRMLRRVSEGVLANAPYMDETRRALLEDALEFHRRFLARHGDRRELQVDAADTWFGVARIRRMLGDVDASDEAFETCDELWNRLRSASGDAPESVQRHARCLLEHGSLHLDESLDLGRALASFDRALELLDAHPDADPQGLVRARVLTLRGEAHRRRLELTDADRDSLAATAALDGTWDTQSGEARALHGLVFRHRARTLLDLDRNEEAVQVLERARNTQELLVQVHPGLDDRARLLQLDQELAEALVQSKNAEGAEIACARTIERQRELIAEHPRVPVFRQGLAVALATMAPLDAARGRHEEAEACYREVLTTFEALHEEYQERGLWLLDLARAQRDLAFYLEARSRHEESSRAIAKALALFDALAARFPDLPEHRLDHAETLNQWAVKQHTEGRAEEAEASYLATLERCEAIERAHPSLPRNAWLIANVNRNLGILLADTQPERAERHYERSNDLQRALHARFPEEVAHVEGLAHGLTSVGILWEDQGKYERAEAAYREALALRRTVLERTSALPDALAEAGGAEHNLASVLERQGRCEEALEGLEHAIDFQRRALAVNDRHPWYRSYLRTSCKLRVEILLDLRRPDAALAAIEPYRASIPEDPGTQRMAAEYFARVASLQQSPRDVESARRAAIAALEEAHRLGFRRKPDLRDAAIWGQFEEVARFHELRAAIETGEDGTKRDR